VHVDLEAREFPEARERAGEKEVAHKLRANRDQQMVEQEGRLATLSNTLRHANDTNRPL